MSVLDLSLVKAPYGTGSNSPATIDGWPFIIDPSTVELPITAKVQKFKTVGGFVVQVYGTTWGDLTVSGQFGTKDSQGVTREGWQLQQAFLARMVAIAQKQAANRKPTHAGQNFTPAQPFQFTYPLLGWRFMCFLKDYTSPDGPMAVHLENTNINPKWTLTLFIVTDASDSLHNVTKQAYLQRLAPGLGMMWDSNVKPETWQGYSQDQYNAPLTNSDLQAYINNPNAGDVVPIGGGPTGGTGAGGAPPDGPPLPLPPGVQPGKPVSTAQLTQLVDNAVKQNQNFPNISAAAHTWLVTQWVGIASGEGGTAGPGMFNTNLTLNTGYGPGAPGTFNAPLPNWNSAYYNAHPSDTEYSVGLFGMNIGYDYYNGQPVEVNYNLVAKWMLFADIGNGPPTGPQVQKLGDAYANRPDIQAFTAIELYKKGGSFRPWTDPYVTSQGGYAAMDAQAHSYGIV